MRLKQVTASASNMRSLESRGALTQMVKHGRMTRGFVVPSPLRRSDALQLKRLQRAPLLLLSQDSLLFRELRKTSCLILGATDVKSLEAPSGGAARRILTQNMSPLCEYMVHPVYPVVNAVRSGKKESNLFDFPSQSLLSLLLLLCPLLA